MTILFRVFIPVPFFSSRVSWAAFVTVRDDAAVRLVGSHLITKTWLGSFIIFELQQIGYRYCALAHTYVSVVVRSLLILEYRPYCAINIKMIGIALGESAWHHYTYPSRYTVQAFAKARLRGADSEIIRSLHKTRRRLPRSIASRSVDTLKLEAAGRQNRKPCFPAYLLVLKHPLLNALAFYNSGDFHQLHALYCRIYA
ncbi:hypothetical protein GMOD_00006973 [Pyrenophora seminiperda CCB06]|uniref:Uncharacterized protein n=1 Tax=Pyrenophora seminiperda CCB06 TaxID=1302712 RepID=A0A3M7MBZ2_9PLEO|nr:hypothetical protein GMOD_00006973 [Pyrenophora seminiperda CCB06]